MKKFSNKLIIFGLIIIFIAPFLPDWFYWLIYKDKFLYDYRYAGMRAFEVIPSVRMIGIMLSVWGIVLTKKGEK